MKFFPREKVAQSREKPNGVRILISSTCASIQRRVRTPDAKSYPHPLDQVVYELHINLKL